MKKTVKTALIAAAGCMVAGGVLMGAGKAAGGYNELGYIKGYHIGWGHNSWMPWTYSMYGIPGLGGVINALESAADIWEDRADEYAADWEDRADRAAERWENKIERSAEGWENAMEEAAEAMESAFDDEDYNVNEGFNGTYSAADTEPGQEVLNGDFERSIPVSKTMKKLDVEIGVHKLIIREGADGTFSLKGTNCDKIQFYEKDGELCVKEVGKRKKTPRRSNNRKLVLTVPAAYRWTEAELNGDMASIEIDRLEADKAELSGDMGSLTIKELIAGVLDADSDMGSITIDNGTIGELEAESSMGSIEFSGIINGNVDASSDMGSIMLNLKQDRTEFNYRLTSSMGSITLDGASYGSLDKTKTIENGAAKKMILKSSMGNIEINFD